ncbi:hypothetical protein GBA52_024766 [Prunus armeniaca]|nr:hypothetical protein GBA52_024766 [Prunus armeniaca]
MRETPQTGHTIGSQNYQRRPPFSFPQPSWKIAADLRHHHQSASSTTNTRLSGRTPKNGPLEQKSGARALEPRCGILTLNKIQLKKKEKRKD